MLALIYRWHRRLALSLALLLLAWMLSGLLHPLLSRVSVPPKQPAPVLTAVTLDNVQPAAAVLRQAGIAQYIQLALFNVAGEAVYQVQTGEHELPRYFSAISADERPALASQWALALARGYVGDEHSAVASITPVTAFSDDYPAINRYLPVWQVRFDRPDQLTVFVDAVSGRPAGIEHRQQRLMRQTFQYLHSLAFLPAGAPRYALQLLLIVSVLLLAGAGIWLWWQQRQRPAVTALRRWHRRMGIILSGFLLMFAVSGAWHLLAKLTEPERQIAARPDYPVAGLPSDWPQQWYPRDADGSASHDPVWLRWQPALQLSQWRAAAATPTAPAPATAMAHEHEHAHEHNHDHDHDHEQARQMPAAAAGWRDRAGAEQAVATVLPALLQRQGCLVNPAQAPSLVNRFSGDYGFLNKRLPVWQLACSNGELWFIDPTDDAIAAQVTAADRAEGWSFQTLHKWHFLDGFGRDVRDLCQALVVLLLVALTVIGVSMYGIRLRQRQSRQ